MKKWYGIEHKSPQFIEEAVYGLCEVNREDVKICKDWWQNPGMLYDLFDPDGLSAFQGRADRYEYADRRRQIWHIRSRKRRQGAKPFCEVNENMKAYGVTTHRHTPEIEEQLSYASGEPVIINFTPHLVPMNRGILATEYASLKEKVTAEEVMAIYQKYYGNEYFIRLFGSGGLPGDQMGRGKQLCRHRFPD